MAKTRKQASKSAFSGPGRVLGTGNKVGRDKSPSTVKRRSCPSEFLKTYKFTDSDEDEDGDYKFTASDEDEEDGDGLTDPKAVQRERRKLAERLVDGRRAEEGPESPANTYEVAYSDTKLEVRKKPLILSDGQLEGFFGNKKSLRGIPCKNGYWFEDVHPESGRKRFRRPTQKEMESEDLSFDVRCKCKRCHGRKNWKKFYAARLERE